MKPSKPCCPTCHRAYPTPRVERLTPTLAEALAWIASVTDGGKVFKKIEAYQYQGLHARLALWGLAEELLHERKTGSGQTRSGQWRPTAKGMQWLSGMTHVPSEVYVQSGRVVGLGTTPISFEGVKATAGMSAKERSRREIEDQADREWAREQARLERDYLEESE